MFLYCLECRQAFRMFDQDNSGTITFDELASVMRILGNNPTLQQLKNMMAELDKDGKETSIHLISMYQIIILLQLTVQ